MIEWSISRLPLHGAWGMDNGWYEVFHNILVPEVLRDEKKESIETTGGYRLNFEYGRPVLYSDGFADCGFEMHSLNRVFLPVFLKKEKELNCDLSPYAFIYIFGYTEFDEYVVNSIKKKRSFLNSLINTRKMEDYKKSKSYLKVFCCISWSISPIGFRIKPIDRELFANDCFINDDENVIYESPYILVNEDICKNVNDYIDLAAIELARYTKMKFS